MNSFSTLLNNNISFAQTIRETSLRIEFFLISEKVFFEDVGDRRGEMRKLSSGSL